MKIETVAGLLFVVMCAVLGVIFRPLWLSDWGPYAFVLFCWVSATLAMGWGGRGKPYSFTFGLVCGTAFAVFLIFTFFNSYVGLAVFGGLLYLGFRTKFFERRSQQLGYWKSK